ncbi:hypothetical protein Bca52824_046304 [Brassica carinata]|uniref:Nucleotidyl transferase domain-containing protein n=1 Tax=Brassica carinata TaxID=52824 RepID=A0A8X7RE82_BRACI|nr:hypothetical protein Bca52824_046304 [Brassica carinata]
MSEDKVVAVIMVGGPTKGTRFRPLSFNTPKPLIPLAGQPMIHHPILLAKGFCFLFSISNLAQIFLIGFYEEKSSLCMFLPFLTSSKSRAVKVHSTGCLLYLKDKPHGSAGALYYFRDKIMEEKPSHVFLLNCDVCCSFPLQDILASIWWDWDYASNQGFCRSSKPIGELIADPDTKELLHYTEKPETFVSDLINCGVYVFTSDIFKAIEGVYNQMRDLSSNYNHFQYATRSAPADFVRLDQDILSPLAGKKQLYTYENKDFWEQIKTPGSETSPHLLASGDGTNKKPMIVGDVYIHPSVKLHPTAKIGPNVSISANVRVGPGVRLINCIILDDVEIKDNAVVINSIIGWKSSIGRWSRVQASGDDNERLGITILGEAVTVEDEVAVIGSIVLQNKTLNASVQDDIIL